jgi:hypothetical protein
MKPNQTVRFRCGDCLIVFDLCVDPAWTAEAAAEVGANSIDPGDPMICPYCGGGELKAVRDRSVIATQT